MVVPILRASIGIMEGVFSLIPSVKKVSVSDLYRNEDTLKPVKYNSKITCDITMNRWF